MNRYPWLHQHYRKIVKLHQNNRAHHALLFKTINGIGDDVLVWNISCWLMCQQKNDWKICGQCHGCQLMQAHTHPDWYHLTADKGKVSIGIDAVRDVIEEFCCYAQQGGAKVMWIPNVSYLTEAAANSLLKTLEEPLTNCWFFLGFQERSCLLSTLRSRCLLWHLLPPCETYSIQWLQEKSSHSLETIITALRLNDGSPLSALKLLKLSHWQKREIFCKTISDVLCGDDVLHLLPVLNCDEVLERLSWLIIFFVDMIKVHYGGISYLSSNDCKNNIIQMVQKININFLNASLQQWMMCREQFQYMREINRELILTDNLLKWSHLLASCPVNSN